MPYRKIAEENAPSTKYLMPASCELNRRRSKADTRRTDSTRAQEHDDQGCGVMMTMPRLREEECEIPALSCSLGGS
jgi:hypothetical protein